jgi:hypothetical protein
MMEKTPVQEYSLYILARSGRLVREIEVVCGNDDSAIDLAQNWVDGYDVELWQLDRMVARFDSSKSAGATKPSTENKSKNDHLSIPHLEDDGCGASHQHRRE